MNGTKGLSREQILQVAIQKMVSNPNARIMVILDKPEGMEMLYTEESYIWMFGLFSAAEKLIDESYRQKIVEGMPAHQEALKEVVGLATRGDEVKN